jgi:S-adenosyl-L-methionine hydrolase (adenosine-forming)
VKRCEVFQLRLRRFHDKNRAESPLPNAVITLTTDYGTKDHLVGALKGVILKINPDVTIVDITHQVTPYDLLDGALAIGSAFSYFPSKTIHVVVVDPGVGTERRPILASADNQYFVAPDNGVLSLIYERDPNVVVRHANVEHYYHQPVSKTFHGRDIFAPVAAWLSKGWQTASMGEVIEDYKRFAIPRPKANNGILNGVVMQVDSFGNLITNFRQEDLAENAVEAGKVDLHIGTHAVSRLVETFAAGNSGETIAYIGSSGYVEIAMNKGNAARTLGLGRGAAVTLDKK